MGTINLYPYIQKYELCIKKLLPKTRMKAIKTENTSKNFSSLNKKQNTKKGEMHCKMMSVKFHILIIKKGQ